MTKRLSLLILVILTVTLVGACQPLVEVPDPPAPEPPTPVEPSVPEPEPEPDPYLILVNQSHPVSADFSPDLEKIQGDFKLETNAAAAYRALAADAKEAGHTLLVLSAYRPYATQERLYKNKVQEYLDKGHGAEEAAVLAAGWVARPGTSEHHTGLAVDILSSSYQRLNAGYADTATAKWLAANARNYGFVLRYPRGKEEITGINFEPWHFRYVGLEHALRMEAEELCLEEYLILLQP